MKVIVNGSNRILPKENNFEGFLYRILCRLCQASPAGTYFFLSNDSKSDLPARAVPVSFKFPLLFRLAGRWAYNRNLKAFIKAEDVKVYITLNGEPVAGNLRQILVIPDNADPGIIRRTVRCLRINPNCSVIVSSSLLRQKLLSAGLPEASVYVLPQAAQLIYQPLSWEQREVIQRKYTGGKAFFLVLLQDVPVHQIKQTLKAFSQFKKWQHSNMQLVLMGTALRKKPVQALLQSYKYRGDVICFETQPEEAAYAAILAAAMAMVYLPAGDGRNIILTEALQCGVPVITIATDVLNEAGGSAVLYCDPTDISRLAGEMVRLYKDEKFRRGLSVSAIAQVLPLREENAVQRLREYIQQADTA